MPINRRSLIKSTAALALAAPAILHAQPAPRKIKLGIIACGGRGRFIGDLFKESGLAEIVALHDYFRDRVDALGERYGIPAAKRFVGLDGYLKMLEDENVEAVAIMSPPYFHPEQTTSAIERGKHVYLAKPVAVDVPGALKIAEAGKKAGDKLSLLVDFQTRANEFYQGAAKAIHEGMLGAPVIGQAFYYAGRLGPQAPPADKSPMARLRNWVFDIPLSGDIIVEQNIHVIDVANWFLNAHPVKAVGAGGRKARIDVGDCYDHFCVTYTYPNDVIIDFSSAQFTTGFDDLCVRICGSKGTVDSHYGGNVLIRAKEGGYKGGNTGQIYKAGAATNIKNFCEAIAAGKTINTAADGAESTLTAIMGRIAAYTGKTVTWDDMIKSSERLDAKLNLPTQGTDWKP
jgi:predicted dehydrogenase